MQYRLAGSLLATLFLLPTASQAETCSAAATLAGVHDAYVALSSPDEQTRLTAAIALLALHLPEADPAKLNAELGEGFDVDEMRLGHILETTLEIARTTLAGGSVHLPHNHVDDTEWLADIVWDSGCETAWGSDGPARRPPPPPPSFLDSPLNLILAGLLLVTIAGGATAGILALRRSRLIRRRELRKQPRKPVSLPAVAVLTTGDRQQVKVLDLSLGGMRITLTDAPPQSSNITLELGDRTYAGSIAWSNDFYAGILLDESLTDTELQELLALNASGPAGKEAPT